VNLLVDLGNSRLKWRIAGRGGATGTILLSGDWPSVLARDWSVLGRPDRVITVSVQSRDIESAYQRCVEGLWRVEPEYVRALGSCCGVIVGYADPSRLGPDRLIAMVGARALTSDPALVVDCGTAVTIDLLDGGGYHRGGWILPGLALMGSALYSRAAGLSGHALFVPSPLERSEFGVDTHSGITEGARAAVAGAVVQAFKLATDRLERSPHCFITGGDSTIVAPLLEGRCREAPDLLFTGLARYAEETFSK
jgi:type III pantothenate kinase